MAHNLFSARFYQNRTTPAWHGLGISSDEPMTATEALALVGSYATELRPLYANIDGAPHATDYRQIIRLPTADDPTHRLFGAPVSKQFELIGPEAATGLWDANVRDADNRTVPLETFGVLGKGERLFMSARLPGMSVRGDEIVTYLLYDNPLYGHSMSVNVVPIRVVCQNTLTAAIGQAVQTKRVIHTAGASAFIGSWLSQVYGKALQTLAVMEDAFNVLAATSVKEVDVRWIVDHVYPMPKRPANEHRSRRPIEQRLEIYEYKRDLTTRIRGAVLDLYKGAGVGFDSPAVKGTAFGAWNAIAEFETYRKGPHEVAGVRLISGDRARRIRKAFDLSLSLETNEAVVLD